MAGDWNLEKSFGWENVIKHSKQRNEHGFMGYRIDATPRQLPLPIAADPHYSLVSN
jgi:hypothetical protein